MAQHDRDGFAGNVYFDTQFNMQAVKLLPGEYHVTDQEMVQVTVLGSCVAACIRDTASGIGGMNHFMLPESGGSKRTSVASTRYGRHAMEILIGELIRLGARREHLEAKVFGGGNVARSLNVSNVGQRNADFVLQFLASRGIRVVAQDLGDVHPRKVFYFPRTGRAKVQRLLVLNNDTIFEREADYLARLRKMGQETADQPSGRGAASTRKKIRVLIVDDSALMRKLMTEIVNDQPDMEAVGAAPDPLVAREMIRSLAPDVLTLDVEMPKMDGLEFLERIMRLRPMPVVMVSTLTERGSEAALRALELGAVDFVAKPKLDLAQGLQDYAQTIADKIRAAASARLPGRRAPEAAPTPLLPLLGNRVAAAEKLIAVGASTGGTEALREFLVQMPPDAPGIVIAQHMPEGFTRRFAERLDGLCRIAVREAVHGERVLPGHAYIAPGHSHLLLGRQGGNYITELVQSEPVNRHRPSVDVLFRSAAAVAGRHAIGVILTGMGKDGAAGMLEMHRAGAHTVAQDEASCIVFGMPKEAIAMGGVDEVAPLVEIARRVFSRIEAAHPRASGKS